MSLQAGARLGRFLMKKMIRGHYSVNIVLNWGEELKRLVPAK